MGAPAGLRWGQVRAGRASVRRDSELKAYMDLFFLALVVLLCVAKIVTD